MSFDLNYWLKETIVIDDFSSLYIYQKTRPSLDTDFDALYAYVTKNWHPITNYHLLVETDKEILLPRAYSCVDENDKNYIFTRDYSSSADNVEVIHTTGKTLSRLLYNELVHKINEGIPELKLYFHEKASADYIERKL